MMLQTYNQSEEGKTYDQSVEKYIESDLMRVQTVVSLMAIQRHKQSDEDANTNYLDGVTEL